ncbi:outer membrane beta-barrel protein [uncultured Legionella sp.]|uniref:outer membrane protein n=1 Tax=uncultured Legionella sp. TaxID=210934 RepID=UPI002634CE8F|nr:outer membrane beta-barrel protein [uncultured Legionella sp.]
MSKCSIIAKGVVVILGMAGAAYADNDSARYSFSNSWTGFYAGINAGLVFNSIQLGSQQLGFTNPSEQCNISSDFSRLLPGIQLGFMHQFSNNFVSGIEANIAFNTNKTETLACDCPDFSIVSDRFSFKRQKQSSIKARVGRTLNWNASLLLPYLTAGASLANSELTYSNEGGDYYSQKTNQTGPLVGAGIEWAFKNNWSLRAEYNYVDYGNVIKMQIPSIYGLIDPNGNARVDLSSNNIVVSINYWI